jgi:hyperosmotically inducible periplasmic protein
MKLTKKALVATPAAMLLAGAMSMAALQAQAADAARAGQPISSPNSQSTQEVKHNIKEGWHEGVVEGAFLFNRNLSALDIDVEVKGSTAVLTGYVDSATKKSLAEQVALGVDGITAVDNKLVVDANKAVRNDPPSASNIGPAISDAAITAKVKSKLLANSEVSGLKVNVDTKDKVVTLKGAVEDDAKRDLVYYITRNTDGVRGVNNKLSVDVES